MKNLLILAIALLVLGANAFAEDKSNREIKGDEYFFTYSFDKAIDYYSHTKNLTVEGQRRLAESHYNLEQNVESEKAYAILMENKTDLLPEDYYQYAMVLKINGKQEASNNAMDEFVVLKPTDLRGKDYSAHKGEFENFSNDDGKYNITTLDINTDRADFAPTYYQDKVVFASSRSKPKMIVKNSNWTGNPYYDLYVSNIDGNQLKKPEIFDKGLNGKMHDGPASFSKSGSFMAFTKNNYEVKKGNKVVELEIHFSEYDDGKWSAPQPFYLNSTEYSVGHPCLSADGNTMYFTSDMSGGYGGSDIYSVTKEENGVWGNPKNIGSKINTEGDEMFPFLEEKSNTLFFSSNGRFGLGGLDVFICEMQGTEAGRVYNAGAPLNSLFDDYALIVDDKMSTGYFSSNRSEGSDNLFFLDLLKVEDVQKHISGVAKDKDDNLIDAAFITLLDGNNNNVLNNITTQNDGAYSFDVDTDQNFKLTGEKDKYEDGNNTANTFGDEKEVIADVILAKEEEAMVAVVPEEVVKKVKKGDDLGKVLAFDPQTIYFDFAKYDIRPDAIADLNEIVKVMNENPTMVIKLGSHTDCRGSKQFNQKLSNNRANASADYIKARISKPGRVSGKGYGETKLVNACSSENDIAAKCSETQHQNNRRTEFIVVKETEFVVVKE